MVAGQAAAWIQAHMKRGYVWVTTKSSLYQNRNERSRQLEALQWGRIDQLPAEPIFTRLNRGKRFGDLLWTTGPTKIASDRFVRVLRESGATGYSTFPVTVRTPQGPVDERYHGLVVFGQPGDDCFALQPGEQF